MDVINSVLDTHTEGLATILGIKGSSNQLKIRHYLSKMLRCYHVDKLITEEELQLGVGGIEEHVEQEMYADVGRLAASEQAVVRTGSDRVQDRKYLRKRVQLFVVKTKE